MSRVYRGGLINYIGTEDIDPAYSQISCCFDGFCVTVSRILASINKNEIFAIFNVETYIRMVTYCFFYGAKLNQFSCRRNTLLPMQYLQNASQPTRALLTQKKALLNFSNWKSVFQNFSY